MQHHAELREGTPVTALLEAIEELRADVIVLGRRGTGGFPGLQLGSTSALVAQHASCPVVLVPSTS